MTTLRVMYQPALLQYLSLILFLFLLLLFSGARTRPFPPSNAICLNDSIASFSRELPQPPSVVSLLDLFVSFCMVERMDLVAAAPFLPVSCVSGSLARVVGREGVWPQGPSSHHAEEGCQQVPRANGVWGLRWFPGKGRSEGVQAKGSGVEWRPWK